MKKKKILLLSDDLRMHSGIATQSKAFVMNTLDHYDWVQIGGAINHPDNGKIMDLSPSAQTETRVKDAYLKIYPISGYGNPDLLREIINIENPDAILHFTDPRFWIWLYQMEHEVRQNIPIFYYNIWDDLPDPEYNTNYYKSCDLLLAISKQTYGINKRLLPEYKDWQVKYVPHGIEDRFFKIDKSDTKFGRFEEEMSLNHYKFKVLYVNRNIRRKNPGDVIMAYKHFMDSLNEAQRKECCLIFHTNPVDDNGTDLPEVCKKMMPGYNVLFTYNVKGALQDEDLNHLYNSADVTINIASNEGFGLSGAESLMCGTPIINNVTGGLQDQCGFKKEDGSYLTADDYVELGSNHRGQYKEHGEWVKPVFPSNISLQGSPLTPYIFDDRCQYEDVGDAIKYWYDKTPVEREECGKLGMRFVNDEKTGMNSHHLSKNFIKYMDGALDKWEPKTKYTLEVV